MKAFVATVRYATRIEPGVIEVEYDLDDPGQLDTIIRQGPGWAALAWVHLRRSCEERFPAIPFEDLPDHFNVSEGDDEFC